MKMKSKTVIITGGGKGIGFGVATAFAKEGADIVITGRQESALAQAKEKLESAYGIRVGYVAGDLGLEETAAKVVAKAIEMTGRLDVLINNAQASKSGVMLADHTKADFVRNVLHDAGRVSLFERNPGQRDQFRLRRGPGRTIGTGLLCCGEGRNSRVVPRCGKRMG